MVHPSALFGIGAGIHKFDTEFTRYTYDHFKTRVISCLLLAEIGRSITNRVSAYASLGFGVQRSDGTDSTPWFSYSISPTHKAMALLGVNLRTNPVGRLVLSGKFNMRFFSLNPYPSRAAFVFPDTTKEFLISLGYEFGG